jgi:peroxiredoxin Q/BCP
MRMFGTVARIVGLIGATVFFTSTAIAADESEVDLQVGEVAPVFQGMDDRGKLWKSSDYVGRKIVVVYFYMADCTTGCINQAESWRDNMDAFTDAGVEVVGVSGDAVLNHKLFKQEWNLNFTLLADEQAQISRLFGVPVRRGARVRPRGPEGEPLLGEDGQRVVLERQATIVHWTFVIGEDGRIAYKNTKVDKKNESLRVLEFIDCINQNRANQ